MEIAATINARYAELPPEKQYDSIIALHNCFFRNGRRVVMTANMNGDLRVSRRSLAIASLLGSRRVILANSNFHRSVGVTGTLDLEIPISSPRNEKKQIEIYRNKIADLAICDVSDLLDVDLTIFTFYTPSLDIHRQRAEDLQLEQVEITRAFEELPSDVVERLGLKIASPYYATSWNYNHFGVFDEEGKRRDFGQVVQLSIFNYAVKKRWPNLLTE